MKQSAVGTFVGIINGAAMLAPVEAEEFNFSRQLFGAPSTLGLFVESVNPATGQVVINGGDSAQPSTPFSWDWGDGAITQGFFPQQHTYANRMQNYVVEVTAHYSGGATDTAETIIRFVAPVVVPQPLPSQLAVSIPVNAVTLGSRMPGYFPPPLTVFSGGHFGIVSRSTIEYVLSVAASIQNDFVNSDVPDVGGGFQQVMLRDPNLSGGSMYSLWFTEPVAFGAAAASVSGSIQYSSFMHEMGHNFTLNTPAHFFYGGKIDGNANAIFSESMAQIFQHATAYQLINNGLAHGIPEDLLAEIKASAIGSMYFVRSSYEEYVQNGAQFNSWNEPGTPDDETFGTFMTVAYKFFEHAETSGQGYRVPLRRMMQLLQTLNQDMVDQYDQDNNTQQAATFRSTLLVAAVSHAFQSDLRSEFASLNFPIDDNTYDALIAAVPLQQSEACCLPNICVDTPMDSCANADGMPAGTGTNCMGGACPGVPSIPAASTWGLLILGLLLLIAGTGRVLESQRRRT